MRVLAILLISQVYISHARGVDSQEDDTVTIRDSKKIVPKLPLPFSMITPLATTSYKLVPAITQSTPTLSNVAEFYVIGGSEVGRLFPWIVSIRINSKPEHLCAGTLISPTSVLTSAFCLVRYNIDSKQGVVGLGSDNFSLSTRDGIIKKVIRIKYHEDFSKDTVLNDIAIVTLDGPVQMGPNIQAVTLGTNKIIAGGTQATMIGWGRTEYSGSKPDQLRQVNVDVISNSDCSAKYQPFPAVMIIPQQLCAGGSGRNSCFGDHGGPLMQNGVQIGILSYIADCDTIPGVYTRVASYLSWINKNKS